MIFFCDINIVYKHVNTMEGMGFVYMSGSHGFIHWTIQLNDSSSRLDEALEFPFISFVISGI